jgi:hypothetical protein
MEDHGNERIDNDGSGNPRLSRRQFMKRGVRLAGAPVAAWYAVPAIEILLTTTEASAQGNSNCPPDLCAPDAFNTCSPVFG